MTAATLDPMNLKDLPVAVSSSSVIGGNNQYALDAVKKGAALATAAVGGVASSVSTQVGEFKPSKALTENITKASAEMQVSADRVMSEVQAIAEALGEKLRSGNLTFNVARSADSLNKGKDNGIV